MKGHRKFSLALLALLAGFVLSLTGDLSAEFATIASVAVGAFSAGNAVEHMAGKGER